MTSGRSRSTHAKGLPVGARLRRRPISSAASSSPRRLKADRSLGRHAPTADALNGRHVAMLFDKPSLRTRIDVRDRRPRARRPRRRRCSRTSRSGSASRSPTSRAISSAGSTRSSSARSRSSVLQEFAAAATRLHVVNALTDEEHPCQAIADFLTLQERSGRCAAGRSRTSATATTSRRRSRTRRRCSASTSTSRARTAYQLPHAVVQQATSVARHGARLRLFSDAADAVAGADAVYTDTWTSMGQEAEAELRRQRLRARTR